MAEEKMEARPANLRQYFPWFELFRAFQVALDPKKLVLAGLGILVMACWWWLCSAVFYTSKKPVWPTDYQPFANYKKGDMSEADTELAAWKQFKEDRARWNLLHETAGYEPQLTDAGDLAGNPTEFERLNKLLLAPGATPETPAATPEKDRLVSAGGREVAILDGKEFVVHTKPYERMRTLPWFEDRGPNPYLLVFGKANVPHEEGVVRWFVSNQVPVLVEPVVKFIRPVFYLLHPNIGFRNFVYFTLVLLGTLAVWALFGGAITRMAVVQIARKEKIGLGEAIRFTASRWVSFFSAPLLPLILVVVITLFLILFGFFHLIPVFGDIIVDGLAWPLVILAGLVMAVVLVGLVGWPMMYATISTEGSDSFDALSRSYSYVYQSPWQYIWYCLVALVYGAAVVFFVGFMGSLMVYLGKWGVSQTPGVRYFDRDPSYLFAYAPTSFGWRDLLLQGGTGVDQNGHPTEVFWKGWSWYNHVGAVMVSVWLYATFLLILGFAYSFFWASGTIIYLLMRRKVDDTDLDEVYLDEDETEEAYTAPSAPAHAPAPAGPAVTMVEAPTLKTPPTAVSTTPPPTPPRMESARTEGDGNPPSPA